MQYNINNMSIEDTKKYEKLYNILTQERSKLVDFLIDNNRSDELEHMLEQIQDSYSTNESVTPALFKGELGPESNKQLAFYELPTYELLATIATIIINLNITHIEEMMAGTGLMSAILNKFMQKHIDILKSNMRINITATDGMNWIETMGNPKYFKTTKKYFIEYLLKAKEEAKTKKIYILSHPTKTIVNELKDFMTKIKPKCIIFIIQEDQYPNLDKILLPYKIMKFYPKQICYRDVFSKSNVMKIYHSSLVVAVDTQTNITHDNIIELSKQLFMNMSDDSYHEPYKMSDLSCLQDCVNKFNINPFILKLDMTNRKKAANILVRNGTQIPKWIDSMETLEFWNKLIENNAMPRNIKTKEKFMEYKTLHNKISNTSISELHKLYIVPKWIDKTQLALKYIYLDYSTDKTNKSWKENKQTFMNFRI